VERDRWQEIERLYHSALERPESRRGAVYFSNASTNAIEIFSFATQRITRVAKAEKPPFGGLAAFPDAHWILSGQRDQDASHIMLVENFRW